MRLFSNVQMGTLGGTLCTIFFHLQAGDILRTVVLAAVGAAVSFAVSKLLNRCLDKNKKDE